MRLQVWVNSAHGAGRQAVECELVLANAHTCWVRLPSGKTVKRKLLRDVNQRDRERIAEWRREQAEKARVAELTGVTP